MAKACRAPFKRANISYHNRKWQRHFQSREAKSETCTLHGCDCWSLWKLTNFIWQCCLLSGHQENQTSPKSSRIRIFLFGKDDIVSNNINGDSNIEIQLTLNPNYLHSYSPQNTVLFPRLQARRTPDFFASVKKRLDWSPVILTVTGQFCAAGRKTRWPAVQSDWCPGTFSTCFHVSTAEWINDQACTFAVLVARCEEFWGKRKSIDGEHHLHGACLAILILSGFHPSDKNTLSELIFLFCLRWLFYDCSVTHIYAFE